MRNARYLPDAPLYLVNALPVKVRGFTLGDGCRLEVVPSPGGTHFNTLFRPGGPVHGMVVTSRGSAWLVRISFHHCFAKLSDQWGPSGWYESEFLGFREEFGTTGPPTPFTPIPEHSLASP